MCCINEKNLFAIINILRVEKDKISPFSVISSEISLSSVKVLISVDLAVQPSSKFLYMENDVL